MHSLTGCDPTSAQWDELSAAMMKKNHVVVFDSAYQVSDNSEVLLAECFLIVQILLLIDISFATGLRQW